MGSLKIYVDSLKHQHYMVIDEKLSPDFFNISEKELKMEHPTHIKGKAYLSSDYLVINFSATTYFQMTCRICNEKVLTPLTKENGYLTINLAEIKNGIYNLEEEVREALLIKLPYFVECKGLCPERKNVEKYLKKSSKKEDERYLPFQDI